ncbi:MAG: ABC transporter permease [Lachnospiraceae bacterium]|nr:ABC transporter permease [Lachnospiraceae bacterium]
MAWIWHLCISNMKKRGIRTLLTILGVVIGVISIVSMVSIGIGVKSELMSSVEDMVSIKEITVIGEMEGKRKDRMLTDRTISDMQKIEGVVSVYPQLTVNGIMWYGNYINYGEIYGVPTEYLEQMELTDGRLPSAKGIKPELVFGKSRQEGFYNENSGLMYGESPGAKSTLTGENVRLSLGYDMNNAESYHLSVVGTTARQYDYNIYTDIGVLKKFLKKHLKDGLLIDQPVNENGENYNDWVYAAAVVVVEDMEQIDSVVKRLQDMGFQTINEKETVDSMQKMIKIAQILLAGIGMIALVVAVIGISNTMTTAVYDRINEIGILKVLGCDPDELQFLFLMESGILGGVGGLVGILFSYVAMELLVNRLAVKLIGLQKGTQLAVIPLWLAFAALVFAIVLGLFAGYFPARWAAKLKPIDAVQKR